MRIWSVFSTKLTQQSVTLAVLVALTSCSSTTDEPTIDVTPTIAETPTQTEKKRKITSAELLKRAQNSSGTNKRANLIKAAQLAFIESGNVEQVNRIIQQIDLEQIGTLREEFALTELLLLSENYEAADVIISRLKKGALPKEYTATLWILINKVNSHNQEHLAVLRQAFRAKSLYKNILSKPQQQELNKQIWLHIQQLPVSTLSQFSQEFGPVAQQWIQLVTIINTHIGDVEQLTKQYAQWVIEYNKLEDSSLLPAQILKIAELNNTPAQHIALILPYTGKLSKQANAIRNGFLTGLTLSNNTKVSFYNSETLSLQDIESKVIEDKIDFIVGPLLKDKIVEYNNSEVLSTIPSLYLNQTTETNISANKYYFSLAPEDEVKQAVSYFAEKGFQYPAVIYANNNWGKRLSQQFLTLWQLESETEADFTAFESQSKLGEAVKELLDVSNSEKRIKEMEGLFGRNLKSEERSRNDIDAIYIIANSQQTRLIKPFFDVNMSTFGKALPIYGSSRSYLVGESREQKKDLNGLIFTEMPWLIQNRAKDVTAAYNKMKLNNTQLKKLFAFGYDASKLLTMVEQLSVLPLTRINGLTGQLQLNEQHQINRKLLWSQYRQGRIYAISGQAN